jgi:hypothetical protein
MKIENQIKLCSENYQKWKSLALSAHSIEQAKKFLEKAFFWLELQTAFITLFSIEQARGSDPEVKQKLITAKANLSKKLTDYAQKILDEIKW